jgi:negative modulator of initiation of replication
MRTIEVDEEVYGHIARNTAEIGESASDILRRLLGLNSHAHPGIRKPGNSEKAHELAGVLSDPKFQVQGTVVDRWLHILGAVYQQKKADFEQVLEIQGRDRRYFARTREEIENSGSSTQPRNIPGTPYWVLTNSPTPQKRILLRSVLKLLGYSDGAIFAAAATLQ